MATAVTRGMARIRNSLLAGAFAQWRAFCSGVKADASALRRAVAKMSEALLRRALKTWVGFSLRSYDKEAARLKAHVRGCSPWPSRFPPRLRAPLCYRPVGAPPIRMPANSPNPRFHCPGGASLRR